MVWNSTGGGRKGGDTRRMGARDEQYQTNRCLLVNLMHLAHCTIQRIFPFNSLKSITHTLWSQILSHIQRLRVLGLASKLTQVRRNQPKGIQSSETARYSAGGRKPSTPEPQPGSHAVVPPCFHVCYLLCQKCLSESLISISGAECPRMNLFLSLLCLPSVSMETL